MNTHFVKKKASHQLNLGEKTPRYHRHPAISRGSITTNPRKNHTNMHSKPKSAPPLHETHAHRITSHSPTPQKPASPETAQSCCGDRLCAYASSNYKPQFPTRHRNGEERIRAWLKFRGDVRRCGVGRDGIRSQERDKRYWLQLRGLNIGPLLCSPATLRRSL